MKKFFQRKPVEPLISRKPKTEPQPPERLKGADVNGFDDIYALKGRETSLVTGETIEEIAYPTPLDLNRTYNRYNDPVEFEIISERARAKGMPIYGNNVTSEFLKRIYP